MVEQKHFWNIHQNFIFGKFVGTDEFGNKYYKNKKDDRWVIYANDVEATKITSDWFLWIHHTINEIPSSSSKKYIWQKKHSQNLSGSSKAYKPNKILKEQKFKIMRLGKSNFFFLIWYFLFFNLNSEDRILSAPVINLESLEPSYENLEIENSNEISSKTKLKKEF